MSEDAHETNNLGSLEQVTTPCKFCERDTPHLGTKLCDPCWELQKSLGSASPGLVVKAIKSLPNTKFNSIRALIKSDAP